jgi:hypothetical protein
MLMRRFEWSAAVPVLVLAFGAVAYWVVYRRFRFDTPVHSDGEGYYAYLTTYLLHGDPTFRSIVQEHILPAYTNHYSPSQFGLILQPNGNYLDKYGLGTAMLLLPFFGAAHAVALVLGVANADGYSRPETFLMGLGALVYTVLGLFALRAVLRRWFSDRVTAVTLVAVTLGTGLVSYFTWEATFSHAFAFFAVAVMLLCALRWFERPQSWMRAALLGLAIGLVVAIRLPNLVLVLAVPAMGIGSLGAVRERVRLIWMNALRAGVVLVSAAVVLIPQLVTWRIASGHWITRPYPGEPFDFLHPHLLESLVWLEPHGLLPYAPVLAFSFIGLVIAWFRRRDIALPVTIAFLPFWYLTSAWWDWSFTAGFGDRAYIDILPLLALPMAYLFASLPGRATKAVTAVVGTVLVVVTCMLLIALWQNRLPESGIDATGYWQLLLHPLRLLGPPIAPT